VLDPVFTSSTGGSAELARRFERTTDRRDMYRRYYRKTVNDDDLDSMLADADADADEEEGNCEPRFVVVDVNCGVVIDEPWGAYSVHGRCEP
jgi:hypothetical protein